MRTLFRIVGGGAALVGMAWVLATAGAGWLVVREPLARTDVLLVMAGAPVYRERLEHAAALYRAGQAARVVLTDDGQLGRWSRELQRNPSSIERASSWLEEAGVPASKIDVLPGIMRGTIDEARAVRQYAAEHRIGSVVVVTSPYHSRRAVWTVRHLLRTHAVTVGSDPVSMAATSGPLPETWWRRSRGWRMVALEYVKLPYYWLAYGW